MLIYVRNNPLYLELFTSLKLKNLALRHVQWKICNFYSFFSKLEISIHDMLMQVLQFCNILHKWILESSKKSKTHEFRPQWQQIFLFCLRERPKVFGLFWFILSVQYTYYIKLGFLCERNPNVISYIHIPPNSNLNVLLGLLVNGNWKIVHGLLELSILFRRETLQQVCSKVWKKQCASFFQAIWKLTCFNV